MTTIYQVSEDDLIKLVKRVMADEFIKSEEAAGKISVSPKTIARWADRGIIKRYYFPKNKLPGIKQLPRYKLSVNKKS